MLICVELYHTQLLLISLYLFLIAVSFLFHGQSINGYSHCLVRFVVKDPTLHFLKHILPRHSPIFPPIFIRSSDPNKYSLTVKRLLPAGSISVIRTPLLFPHKTTKPFSIIFLIISPGFPLYSLLSNSAFQIFIFLFS